MYDAIFEVKDAELRIKTDKNVLDLLEVLRILWLVFIHRKILPVVEAIDFFGQKIIKLLASNKN